ncbi:hypothetical protein L7F22_033927 [Adiantum nelumboides]|nr:hypothetical protein [Adiantum nelumboides]
MTFARYDECGGQLNPKKCHLAQPRVKLLGHVISENGIEADLEKVEALLLLSSLKDTRQLASFIQKVKYLSRFIHLASQLLYPLQQAVKNDPLEWTHECEDVFDKVKEVQSTLSIMQAPDWKKEFYVNPSVGNDAIGAMLLQRENSGYPGRFTYKETPVLVKEEVVQKKKVETFAISNASLLYFDGSYRRSHDVASGGIVVYDAQGNLVRKQGLKLDAKSNNEAEYMALEGGLHVCLQTGIKRLQIKGDALLVVKQVLGVWKNKNPKLKNLCFKVKALLKKFEAWSLQHVERSQNEEAHKAAQGMITCVFVVKANAPLYHGREMLSREADFLLTGILPRDLLPSKKYAFMRKARKSKILDDGLYMKGSDLILRRVPWIEEIYKILEENHEGSCGGTS